MTHTISEQLIKNEKVPRHVAIIMDGNGRWAEQRNKARVFGHRAGVETVKKVVEDCAKRGVEVLSLFAFSSENWRRPQQEVGLLMDLFMTALGREVQQLHENNIRLRMIGGLDAFSDKLQKSIADADKLTGNNTGLTLVIAVNYGGRWDIARAARRLAELVHQGELAPEDINEELMGDYISLCDLPEPDLFIRTGGEQRISNFMLWQLAYTELFFTETLWPDFDTEILEQAFASFASRQRRFGYTGQQIEETENA